MKALNLYAGIGGNRALWAGVDVVAVEHDPRIAAEYARRFPSDTVIVGDAHAYLEQHYAEFDFIWSSPPCPTHSRMWGQNRTPTYPDMRLYQEIIFLLRFAKCGWVVENVKPYYRPLVEPSCVCGRHVFWSNLEWMYIPEPPPSPASFIKDATLEDIAAYLGIEPVRLTCNGNHDPRQALRNCVHPMTGLSAMEYVMRNTRANTYANFDQPTTNNGS